MEILEARVIQKVGTEAEWLANPLPLLDGEAAIVRTGDGMPVNLKFGDGGKTFAELPYFIDYSQAAYIAYEATPTQPVAYTFVGEGTYGAITVAEGYMAVLGWDGTSWSKNAEIEIPNPDLTPYAKLTDVFSETGNNLFNKETVISGIRIGENSAIDVVDSTSAITAIIPVTGGKAYTILGKDAIGDNTMRYLDASGNPLRPLALDGTEDDNYIYNTAYTRAPLNAVGVQYTVRRNNVGGYDNIMVVEGAVTNASYEPYKELIPLDKIKSSEKLVRKEELFTYSGKNMLDKLAITNGKVIRVATGVIDDDPLSSISGIMKVKADETFVKSGGPTSAFSTVFLDVSGNPLKPLQTNGTEYTNYATANGQAFKSPTGAVSLLVLTRFNNVDFSNTIQVERASVATAYEPFQPKIGKELLPDMVDEARISAIENTQSNQQLAINTLGNDIADLSNEVSEVDARSIEAQNKANDAMLAATNSLTQAKSYTDSKQFGSPNISQSAITPEKLSQSTLDLINASGGGTITNLADDEDIANVDNELKFKDGAEGFARIRVKSTPALQVSEIIAKSNAYGFILIKDVLDFGSTPSARVTLAIPNGTTVRFVGNGRLKNVRLTGNFKIEAGRKQVFENVEMYNLSGYNLSSDLNSIVLTTANTFDFWDRKYNVIYASGNNATVNPYYTKRLYNEVGTPALNGSGKWNVVVGASTWIKLFDTDVNGNIYLFRSHRFLFIDKTTGIPLTQETYADPNNVQVRRVNDVSGIPYCTIQASDIYPEWWGASTDSTADNTDAFNHCLSAIGYMGGGIVQLQSGRIYYNRGGIIGRNMIRVEGNLATLALKNNSEDHLLIQDTLSMLDSFDANNLILNGGKANQTKPLNGIFFDHVFGEDLYETQLKYTSNGGYSYDRSNFNKVYFEFFSGDGVWVAVPGDVNMFGCRFYGNTNYGVYWKYEHIKLIECSSWSNLIGLGTQGIHFRIIGGAYAHNVKYNMEIVGGSEFQILLPSMIDCNEHGLYMRNCKTFIINGVRTMTSGRAGIYCELCSDGIISNSLVFSNNRKDVSGSSQQAYNNALPVPDTTKYDNVHLNTSPTVQVLTVHGSRDKNNKNNQMPIVTGAKDLSLASTYFGLVGSQLIEGSFKFILGTAPTNAPAGISGVVVVEISASIAANINNRYYVTVYSIGDSGKRYFRDFVYNTSTNTDTTTSTVWKEIY